jgi:glycosyltransferase XagB
MAQQPQPSRNKSENLRWVNRLGDDSAKRTLTPSQKAVLWTLLFAITLWMIRDAQGALQSVIGTIILVYVANMVIKSILVTKSLSEGGVRTFDQEELDQILQSDLPFYSVLVAIRGEENVVERLVKNLSRLIYKEGKLQVLLLLDEDDEATYASTEQIFMPEYFEVIRVPIMEDGLHTKPHVLNYGLEIATGDYCVIYDAEDEPDPYQLLKALAEFTSGDNQLACVQARLSYWNPDTNLLTRLFGLEYTNHFRLILPGLSRLGLVVPLGGTSNHFPTLVLKRLLGWDRYNVTEDLDLGVRIKRQGLTTSVIDSVTMEEASSYLFGKGGWVNQRSRWIKGYMQTYWVHMRNPFKLWRDIGTKNFLAFQILIGGTWLSGLVNPLFWTGTLLYWGARILGITDVTLFVDSLYPTPILYLGTLCLFLGNPMFIYHQLIAVMISERYKDIGWALLLSFPYWALSSIASFKAQLQLLRPGMASFWEKTSHGKVEKEPNLVVFQHPDR